LLGKVSVGDGGADSFRVIVEDALNETKVADCGGGDNVDLRAAGD
jgi:hypothetical protein